MFLDMTIHDFDMVRFLAGCNAEEVYVEAGVLVDPAIGEAGDVDTAVITLKMENGSIAEIDNSRKQLTKVRIGITHTSESNLITEVLARCSNADNNFSITIITDTINNLYDMLDNYEIDLAVVDGTPTGHSLCSLMLATDYLVCVMSIRHPLAKRAMVTLSELKQERMILRLPTSDTRMLFESTLKSVGDSIDNFNITLEVDNIATIKDLVRKGLGVSILPQSACAREQKKGKMAVLPIENLSMMRETKIVYKKDFTHMDILQEITRVYHETARSYQ